MVKFAIHCKPEVNLLVIASSLQLYTGIIEYDNGFTKTATTAVIIKFFIIVVNFTY